MAPSQTIGVAMAGFGITLSRSACRRLRKSRRANPVGSWFGPIKGLRNRVARIGERRRVRAARSGWVLVLLVLVTGCAPASAALPAQGSAAVKTWSVTRNGPVLQIGYGSGISFPQYAALHLDSGYFRMIYGTTAGWGTSVILLPALWSKTSCPTDYCQGAPVIVTWRKSGANLVFSVRGTIATLKVVVTVTLAPPANSALVAQVSAKVAGAVKLDGNRPGEAFKPVMLSSMHDSSTVWDVADAFTGTHVYPFPPHGWIIHPSVTTRDFGLQGGTSTWKTNAPTIEVNLNQSQPVTGWLAQMTDPNNDNVGLWCATSKVLTSWSFTVTAEAGSQL
jgi:hypothetical protein